MIKSWIVHFMIFNYCHQFHDLNKLLHHAFTFIFTFNQLLKVLYRMICFIKK
jgi:hypothetical protein